MRRRSVVIEKVQGLLVKVHVIAMQRRGDGQHGPLGRPPSELRKIGGDSLADRRVIAAKVVPRRRQDRRRA